MTKSVFKTEYSSYRKSVKIAYIGGLESFRTVLNSNELLKRIYLNSNYSLPISIKIWLYKNSQANY